MKILILSPEMAPFTHGSEMAEARPYSITASLFAGLQIILPGEAAPGPSPEEVERMVRRMITEILESKA